MCNPMRAISSNGVMIVCIYVVCIICIVQIRIGISDLCIKEITYN